MEGETCLRQLEVKQINRLLCVWLVLEVYEMSGCQQEGSLAGVLGFFVLPARQCCF